MPRIRLLPYEITVLAEPGESIFDAVRRAGVAVPSACFGRANCGLCRVKVVAGEEHLSPLAPVETRHLGNVYHLSRLRLSCQARVHGDVEVLLPDARRARPR